VPPNDQASQASCCRAARIIQGQGNRLVDEKQVKEFIAQHGAGAVPILKDLNFKGKLALIQSEVALPPWCWTGDHGHLRALIWNV